MDGECIFVWVEILSVHVSVNSPNPSEVIPIILEPMNINNTTMFSVSCLVDLLYNIDCSDMLYYPSGYPVKDFIFFYHSILCFYARHVDDSNTQKVIKNELFPIKTSLTGIKKSELKRKSSTF